MLPGLGGGELIVIALVALLVVGPKDLPKLLRQVGRFVGKMRSMADDFRSSFEDMARQSELDDLRKEVEALRNNKISVMDDIKTEIEAVESDVRKNLTPETHYYSGAQDVPSPDAADLSALEPPVEADPQMEGLPPKAEDTPAPVKKPRARKASQPTAETTSKPKRVRAKSTLS